jgi:hypothetical protein
MYDGTTPILYVLGGIGVIGLAAFVNVSIEKYMESSSKKKNAPTSAGGFRRTRRARRANNGTRRS